MSRRSELLWGCAVAITALGLRLAWIMIFPTLPFSDFAALRDFAIAFTRSLFAPDGPWWQFNVGLPLAFSFTLRALPGSPDAIGRCATTVVSGLVPLVPFVLWRGALSFRVRLVAALLLALWPGQAFFSGVLAQENWVLLPMIATVCLAVRALAREQDVHPVLSALLFASAVAVRQEMLLVLLPATLVAAGVRSGRRWALRNLAAWGLSAAVLLGAVAGVRAAGSGRFSLTTEHAGLTMLGSVVPGAGTAYWIVADPYLARVAPELLADRGALRREAFSLAIREIERRPRFHLIRMIAAVTNSWLYSDAEDLYFSIGAREALPPSRWVLAAAFVACAGRLLRAEGVVILGAFLLALGVGIERGSRPILLVALVVLLKVAIHAAFVAMPRLFVPVTALELLAVALACESAVPPRRLLLALAATAATVVLVAAVACASNQYILAHDEPVGSIRPDAPPGPLSRSPTRFRIGRS